ncbi:lysophospholipid acyltransferase family protein [Aliikangiella maris]|uniref:Lysophospholipid acyltransferase family protein n=2 Tax=Aliikangiella maris TaxID=3162458 RepID=A0ABV2BXB8_9GAMM
MPFFIRLIIKTIHWLNEPKRMQVAQSIIGFIFKRSGKTFNRTVNNIQQAMPDSVHQQAEQLAIKSYQQIAYGVLEMFWLNELAVEVVCSSEVSEIIHQQRGAVIATLHMNCYDVVPLAVQKISGRSTTLSKIPQFYPQAIQIYQDVGIRCINKSDKNVIFQLVSEAKNGQLVSLHADHYATDVAIEFFNRATRAASGVALISAMAQVPLLLGYAVKQGEGKYQVILEVLQAQPLARDISQIEQAIKQMYQRFEKIILQYPEQWYWSYNRWR